MYFHKHVRRHNSKQVHALITGAIYDNVIVVNRDCARRSKGISTRSREEVEDMCRSPVSHNKFGILGRP